MAPKLMNEVKIDLDMLHPLMLNWVGGYVDHTHVVAVDNGSMTELSMELMKKLA